MRRRCLFFIHTSWDHVRCEGLRELFLQHSVRYYFLDAWKLEVAKDL